MPDIERLNPESYRRQPWKNGGGELVNISGEGNGSWQNMGVAWQYGRTRIPAPGPFSDLAGYERHQVVIKGRGLVLVTPAGDIDLREPFRPVSYDGATPIITRLENGAVEVANLIADRRRFQTSLRVGAVGEIQTCQPGLHIVHAAAGPAILKLSGNHCPLPDDHAVRVSAATSIGVEIIAGRVLIASVQPVS